MLVARQLFRVLATGMHGPDLQHSRAIADKNDGAVQLGPIDLPVGRTGARARTHRHRLCLRRLGLPGRRVWSGNGDLDRLGLDAFARAAETITVGTEAGIGIDRKFLEAAGGPALFGHGVPGAAAQHAHLPGARPARVVGWALAVIALAIIVVTPLPHVAVHVIEAPAVGLLLPHRPGRATR